MDQLFKFVNNLNTAQRAVILGGFSLLFIMLIGLLVYSNLKAEDDKHNFTIASNLTKNQVMMASNELESAAIPFSIIGSGNNLTLKTTKDFINIAKIKLVTSEASSSKHSGWELFEKSSLGTTNFENKVKYLRALEGELSKSLESLSGILRATVKVGIPKDTIFTERKTPPTASAVLSLKPGIFLTQKQINGIKNFIASAVPDLMAENIKLIDQDGSLLQESKEDVDSSKFALQNKYKERMERDYENKIISLLEPFVGAGKVVARVSLELNFMNREMQEEIFEPEGTIVSQESIERSSSKEDKDTNAEGVPGVQSNIQDPNSDDGNTKSKSSNEEAINKVNYEISKKIISQKDNAFATIKKISTAVTFDSTILKDVDNKQELVDNIRSIVEDTVGFDDKRGDQVSVKDFKFISPTINRDNVRVDINGNPIPGAEGADTVALVKSTIKELGEYIQYLIAAVLLFVFYKKFIANHEVVVMGEAGEKAAVGPDGEKLSATELEDDELYAFGQEFDTNSAKNRLKNKVKSQIMNNIDGLDEESAAKYEVLIEEIDKIVNEKPEEMAGMIELLLAEGSSKLKKMKREK